MTSLTERTVAGLRAKGRLTPVLELMYEYGQGRVSVDDTTRRLQELLVPAVVRERPRDLAALFRAEQDQNLPIYTPNSWDDVTYAYVAYKLIAADQYEALDRAATPPTSTIVHDS